MRIRSVAPVAAFPFPFERTHGRDSVPGTLSHAFAELASAGVTAEAVREAIAGALSKDGHDVTVAANAQEAEPFCRGCGFDLVLGDFGFRMDGQECMMILL